METRQANIAALAETTVFLQFFKDMPDRRQQVKVIYPLAEILLLCLLAVLAGADSFVDIARFGEKKLDLLRRFRPFENGAPSHDHLGDIFATLDAKAFHCFVAWVASLTKTPAEVIAIVLRQAQDEGQNVATLLSKEGFKGADPRGVGLLNSSKGPRVSASCSDRSR